MPVLVKRSPSVSTKARLARDDDSLGTMLDRELGKNGRDVVADCLLGNSHQAGDFGIYQSTGDTIKNLPFARTQRSQFALRLNFRWFIASQKIVKFSSKGLPCFLIG